MIHLLKTDGRAAIVLPDGSFSGDGVKQRIRKKFLEECNLHTVIRLPNSIFKPYATVATNLLFFTKGAPTKEIWYYQHTYPEGVKSYSKTNPIKFEEFEELQNWWSDRQENDVAWKVSIDEIISRNYDLDIKNPTIKDESPDHSADHYINNLKGDLEEIDAEILKILESQVKIDNYRKVNIGEICDVIKGSTGIKKAVDGKYPLVTTGEDRATHDSFQFDLEAVCIPLVSSTGHGHASIKRLHYQEGKFALGSILAAVIPRNAETISTRYLFYYLNNFKDEIIVPLMQGMANVSLSVTKIKTIPIVIPELEVQNELVALMAKCEALRETLAKSQSDAENMIKAIMKEAFMNSM